MIRIKICGITSEADARAAAEAGADAIGFVFAQSPRQVTAGQARVVGSGLPPFVSRVGVFVNPSLDSLVETAREARLNVIQLHGQEDNDLIGAVQQLGYAVIKAVAVNDRADLTLLSSYTADALLLDKYDPNRVGGTGATFDWRLACEAKRRLAETGRPVPVILAGGLDPHNVQEAIRAVTPYGIDVSSGVELAPGKKCPMKMVQFVKKARLQHGRDQTARGA